MTTLRRADCLVARDGRVSPAEYARLFLPNVTGEELAAALRELADALDGRTQAEAPAFT